jgi:peptidylprolyl isomerase
MKNALLAAAALALPLSLAAEDSPPPSSNEIVAQAKAEEWVAIPAEDLLVMTLAPPDQGPGQASAEGNPRTVVIQLMPAPFSQGWVSNIRKLARAKWYDNISVNRVQDNYVVQWGDPNYDNPEATGETKPLPEGLKVMGQSEYLTKLEDPAVSRILAPSLIAFENARMECRNKLPEDEDGEETALCEFEAQQRISRPDPYAPAHLFYAGWPLALGADQTAWPTHCYGMVGVGRNYSPDTGSGAELYTVIGHAPRHLDRNIALVGRVISGMEHLSSLPRGKGDLGFYAEDEFDKRTPILTVRVASDLPAAEQPEFEYLSTESDSFARYADARANHRDAFFIVPAGGADICNIPVPVRAVSSGE